MSELVKVLENQRPLEAIGYSRQQAWRILNGKCKLNVQAEQLLKLHLGIHEHFELHLKS